jgi:hypothetical protein
VPKPPQSSPHSDIEGVHKDERSNIDSANAAGQGGGDLDRAHEGSHGRPPYADDRPNRDDRSA